MNIPYNPALIRPDHLTPLSPMPLRDRTVFPPIHIICFLSHPQILYAYHPYIPLLDGPETMMSLSKQGTKDD
jgi:hypothetical protein